MLTSHLCNASLASSLQSHSSTRPSVCTAAPPPTLQQGTIRASSSPPSLPPGGMHTSKIKASMIRFPSETLTRSQNKVDPSVTANGEDSGILSSSVLSNALQNPSLRQAAFHLPDGTLAHRTNSTPAQSPSSPNLSSALLNSNVCKATYKLPDGTFVTQSQLELLSPSPMLSTAPLNCNAHSASYQLPDSPFLKCSENENQKTRSAVSSPELSSALMNANLRKAKFQVSEGSLLLSRTQTQGPTSPVISSAMQNPNLHGTSFRLPNTSPLRQPGSANTSQSRSLDLSNALLSQSIQSATYNLPAQTVITHVHSTTAPQILDLSGAAFSDCKMKQPCAPSKPEPLSPNLSDALQNPHLRLTSFHLPSSYAVVSPQVQGSGHEQHWAQGPGVVGLGVQQDMDAWDAERVLPHRPVQNRNMQSMYRYRELVDPQCLMGQQRMGHELRQWNLSREGEPQGHWFDKVKCNNFSLS